MKTLKACLLLLLIPLMLSHCGETANTAGEKDTAQFIAEEPTGSGDITTAPQWAPGFPMLNDNDVMFMWTPVAGAVKYRVYYYGKVLGELTAPTLTLPAPKGQGPHKYTVVGVDSSGVEGPSSSEGQW